MGVAWPVRNGRFLATASPGILIGHLRQKFIQHSVEHSLTISITTFGKANSTNTYGTKRRWE
jgi:hypothetical protein